MRINTDVLQRLDAVEFPSPPAVVGRLSQLLNQEQTTAAEISAALELDATMAARVLRLANSVALGGDGNVHSVSDAVLRVGVETIRDIVYALSMMGVLQPITFEYRPFWKHCLTVAHATRLLQERTGKAGQEHPEAYAAGLLHDIGMLVFDRALGSRYKTVLAKARARGRPLWEVETELLGIDHAEAGARMLTAWAMPTPLVEAARLHHRPGESEERVAHLVNLADLICNNLGYHHGTGFLPALFAADGWARLGLEVTALPTIAVEVRKGMDRVERLLAAA